MDIKPANMEELTEVITAAELHPHQCNVFVYSSSKGTVRLCDMRSSALCDRHSKCKCPPAAGRSPTSCVHALGSAQSLQVLLSGPHTQARGGHLGPVGCGLLPRGEGPP